MVLAGFGWGLRAQAAKRKLREVVEKRAEGDLEAVLLQVEEASGISHELSRNTRSLGFFP